MPVTWTACSLSGANPGYDCPPGWSWNTSTASACTTITQSAGTWISASTGAATLFLQVTSSGATGQPYGSTWSMNVPAAAPLSAEEQERIRAKAEQRRARRQLADARAHALLLSLLDPDQAATYTRDGFIELQGSAGGWWRINRRGQAGNVDELPGPGQERIASWCCHPPGYLPDADAHAAQYLELITNETRFRATGNRTLRRRLPTERPPVTVQAA